MSTVIAIAKTDLEEVDCAKCGVCFAVPTRIIAERRSVGGDFYCPNGHSLTYKNTELLRLKAELDQANAKIVTATKQKEWAEQAQRKAEKALQCVTKRVRKGVRKGVCPCCKRSFVNLQRHMKTKHPEELETEP